MSSKRWVFTLNNYTSDHEDYLRSLDCVYLVFGKEVGESGTPHLQGFVTFKTMHRLSAMKKLLPTAHWEIAKAESDKAANYCKKDNDYYEKGTVPTVGGRSDLSEIHLMVKAGATDAQICDKYPSQFYRYFAGIAKARSLMPVVYPSVVPYPLTPWQQNLNELLNRPPQDRIIHFMVDKDGNVGKSWFTLYYASLHPGKVQIMKPGRKADMAYELKTDIRVFFLDCPRSRHEVLDYDFLESLKDRLVFSPKYASVTKVLPPLHVVVMINEEPDRTKLSSDRYDIWYPSPIPS